MIPSAGTGPINALIATSVVMNALITGILQVYSTANYLTSVLDVTQAESQSPLTGTGSDISSPT
jgi:hypothetical protein